jgi:hypothetical protein
VGTFVSQATLGFHVRSLINADLRMPSIADDAQHWLHLADEARAVAAKMTNPEPKLVMLDIAVCYMRLAKCAEQRSGSSARRISAVAQELPRHIGV